MKKNLKTKVEKIVQDSKALVSDDKSFSDEKFVEINTNTLKSDTEDFTPMPKAKMLDSESDIRTLWANLLSHIKSAPTQALLKLANPVKISPEEVIITFKQAIFVKQANDGTKKTSIMEAADEMFGQKNTLVTIRTPLDSDIEIGKIPQVVKPSVPIKHVNETKSLVKEVLPISEAEIDEFRETQNISEKNVDSNDSNSDFESDQSKMIKNLFDGKYIN